MTLLDDMLALLPDNTSGDISAGDMRTIVTDLYNAAQPLDTDLTTIAGLTATTDNMIQSVGSAWASRTPAQVKTALSLNNVDNTSDASKPVSTAQQTALNLKANIASPTFTGTVSGITAAMVGLGSVDNTSDASKPVSTAQQTALDLKANIASPTFTGTVSGITAAMVSAQPVDTDLTTIAALTATTDSFMQAKGSAWSARTVAQVLVDLAVPGTTFQPLDSDLTTIAALTATTDNFIQSKASAWASRTPAQVAADIQGSVTITESQVTGLVSDLAGKQPLDSDLTTIAALTATTDSFMQAKGSAWSARTVAQVLVDLAAAGTTFQPLDSDLTTIASLTATTDSFMQAKGSAWSARTVAQVLTDLAVPGTTFQPLDSDLTTIASLTATTDNFLQSKSSAWASRTPAQVSTDLQAAGLAPKASPALTGTATAVNLTMSGRQLNTPVALTPGGTVSVDASLGNDFTLTAGQNFTLANPTNAVNGQKILFAIRQDGTGTRVMTLDTNYRLGTDITAVVLTTAINKTDYLGVRYNGTDSKWDVIAFVKGY